MRRHLDFLTLLAAPLLVLTTITPVAVLAQSEEDVARAADAARRATVRAVEAERTFGVQSNRLIAALDDYQRLSADLLRASFEVAALRDAVRLQEAEMRTRTDEARQLIIGAYAAATVGELGPVLDLASFEQIAIVSDLLARSAVVRDGSIGEYESARDGLERRRADLDAAQAEVANLRSRAERAVAGLESIVAAAAVEYRDAESAAVAASAAHDRAAAELEAAKNSVGPRSYAWRPLIERYFPPELMWEALQVLDCESRGDPDATNPISGAAGLFQFLEGTWLVASTFAGYPGASPYEPEPNVASAAWLVRHSQLIDHPRGTWGHWECQPPADTPTGSG